MLNLNKYIFIYYIVAINWFYLLTNYYTKIKIYGIKSLIKYLYIKIISSFYIK